MSEIQLPEGLTSITRDIMDAGEVSREQGNVMIIMAKPGCELLRVDCQYKGKDNHFELDIMLSNGSMLETSLALPKDTNVIWIMGPCPIQTANPQLTKGQAPMEYDPKDPEMNRP